MECQGCRVNYSSDAILSCCGWCCRVEPPNEYYDGERDNDRDDSAVDV